MKPHVPTVYVVDDDDAVREALGDLLESVGLSHRSFASSEEFLAAADSTMQGCLLLDVRMPGMSGLGLQHTLQEHGVVLPVIIITGHGDVPMAVRAMKSGASDFIEKPFNEQYLLDRIHAILEEGQARWHNRQTRDDALSRFSALTPREKMVMELIAAGHNTKKIAAKLDIQDRTVDVHRFNIMHKAGVRTLAELLLLWTVAHQPVQR
jgi:two-component system, LuxR family, response regulator FixJ